MNPEAAITLSQIYVIGSFLAAVITATSIVIWRVSQMKAELEAKIIKEREARLEMDIRISREYTSHNDLKEMELSILRSITSLGSQFNTMSNRVESLSDRIDRLLEKKLAL